ncbi:glutamate dehydrogenase (NAD) [Motilibacter rhizosphaerae]|uniref:Glutamate dehydrogenase (NAD) n=1 Tax=Motilibacter rhizosphaerae TaxID=598652 RepID=A0A4Q7NTI6_9ACTN|nr:NAD-glutamate dehydrogenase [Motilibacter rhizosphaerae]RZS90118.1 glutamate dehydrogenase (NAD) [Motilibacter rhizosphaerae]
MPAAIPSAFEELYLGSLSPEDRAELDGRAPAVAAEHRALAARRGDDETLVRVRALAEGGTRLSVEVVTDDMPFLVDSLTAVLTRLGLHISWVAHPQLAVRRDGGRLVDVVGTAGDACPEDCRAESWIHVEATSPVPVAPVEVEAAVQGVLGDVRAAVTDWAAMRERALEVAAALASTPPAVPAEEVEQAEELLRWMADDAFTFLGYAEYALQADDALVVVPGTALGLLRPHEPASRPRTTAGARHLDPAVRAKAREPKLLVLTKANSRSTVHRAAYLDYVGVKVFDAAGQVVGERRFIGLLATTAYTESVRTMPVVRQKVADVLARLGTTSHSHSGRAVLQVLETYPRDELLAIGTDQLESTVRAVVQLQERRRVRLFVRRDDYGRFATCLLFLPRDRYSTQTRLRLESVLRRAFSADSVTYSAYVTESVLARLFFVVRSAPGSAVPDVDVASLEARLAAAVRTWEDELAEALAASVGEDDARRLGARYGAAFPEAYKEDFDALQAVQDLRRLESLEGAASAGLVTAVSPPDADGARRFTVYRTSTISISRVLPVLDRMGVEVLDERPYELERGDGSRAWVYVLGVRGLSVPDGYADSDLVHLFQDAFAAVWHGQAESDGLDQLVVRAGLSWRQVAVLRALTRWLRQASPGFAAFTPAYVERALVRNALVTRGLSQLFEARLDPARETGRETAVAGLRARVEQGIEAIEGLDDDRILRGLLGVVLAVLRTTYFQLGPDGGPKDALALKIATREVPDVVEPRPAYEVFVSAPAVEGVHLRFGAVARGGLRWSDRPEDFRTEVLGLVKAQAVKNAVIVPVGAKGGFVVRAPKADPADREAVLAEGVAAYRTFVRALLDLTDNRVQRGGTSEVVPPPRVVRHDGDDPYLVVAADKGTATFSDIANAIAFEAGFWLGDAFASGGSAGYDHKAMGITARGAWEAVQRRFRELGHDVQSAPTTVVGVGDMSGDVFGNGMLLSTQLRLVAAFDHRHVFLDPDPDPAVSYAERRRLFALPRSSWADYDAALLSPGGGVFPRTLKHIPVSPQVRARLGLPDDVEQLAPAELLRAVLLAPVDLLWNGGIGTYVKASSESSADVGDKANDAIRVDGRDLRVRVVGEGGNLGLTQLGRVEAAQAGVLVGTDAIDNSAGVDTSDHEVNIKIVVDEAVRDGALAPAEREPLLAAMTDDVAALVLRDNIEQSALLGLARVLAPALLPVHRRLLRRLEERGLLQRRLERLPDDAELRARGAAGRGLTAPEYAVLLAYVKNTLADDVAATPVPDEPWTAELLRGYFPPLLRERLGARLDAHPLRREIVTTRLVNRMVNTAGATFAFRAQEETGAPLADVARAYAVVERVFGVTALLEEVESLGTSAPVPAQDALVQEVRRLVDRAARWFLSSRPPGLDVEQETARYAGAVGELGPRVPELVSGVARARLERLADGLAVDGVPRALAARVAALLDVFALLDVVEVARSTGTEPAEAAPVYYAVMDALGLEALLARVAALPRGDRWQAMARASVRSDVYGVGSALTAAALAAEGATPAERVAAWASARGELVERTRATVGAALAAEPADLAAVSVAVRALRSLLR